MPDSPTHYRANGFPTALSRYAASSSAALILLFFSLAGTGFLADTLRLVAAIFSIYVLASFRISVIPRDADAVERLMMWGLYSFILILALSVLFGAFIFSL